jgi:hypothetical protein
MTELHALRSEDSKSEFEKVSPGFRKEKLLWARDKSWEAFHKIKSQLKEGMTEREAFELCMNTLKEMGVSKHWHKPYVRFGPGTTMTFYDDLQNEHALKKGDPVYMDLGPAWLDEESGLIYEGDVGDSFVFEGINKEAEKCAQTARDIFKSVEESWKSGELTGAELFEFMKNKVHTAGYVLTERVQGHRISDFPHHRFTKEKLGQIDFYPEPLLWVLEVHLRHPELPIGAFYEEILGL